MTVRYIQYEYSSEQQEFKDSLRKFMVDHYSHESRLTLAQTAQGYSKNHWQQLADLGVLSLPFSEDIGGLGTDLPYLMAAAEEFGRGLLLEPFFASTVLASRLLNKSDNSALKQHWAAKLISGESIVALAWEEMYSKGNPLAINCQAVVSGAEFRLSGEKQAVLAASQADVVVVSAKIVSGQTASGKYIEPSIGLFLVPVNHPGVGIIASNAVDGSRIAKIRFIECVVGQDASLFSGNAAQYLQQTLSEALVVMGAEVIGAADMLLEQTVEYCKTRTQFGMPLGAFQALQHRLADMSVCCERLRSLVWVAANSVAADPSSEETHRFAKMLKAEIGSSGRYIGQQAIQLHGGIGMTEELCIGSYFKRLTFLGLIAGSRDDQLESLATTKSNQFCAGSSQHSAAA